jgi:selenocysteine lyase/cysteine desulfurase
VALQEIPGVTVLSPLDRRSSTGLVSFTIDGVDTKEAVALQEIPGVTVLSPLDRRSSTGLVSFTIDGVDTKEAVARLWEQHRIVARWVGFPPGIRIALHFFNTEEEVNKVVEAVQELA